MNPKWQRARFIYAGCAPEVLGHEIWVDGQSVNDTICGCAFGCRKRSILINTFADDPNWLYCIHLDALELLPQFADDVPIIPWDEFLAECRGDS